VRSDVDAVLVFPAGRGGSQGQEATAAVHIVPRLGLDAGG
jgi:hypothetical protein